MYAVCGTAIHIVKLVIAFGLTWHNWHESSPLKKKRRKVQWRFMRERIKKIENSIRNDGNESYVSLNRNTSTSPPALLCIHMAVSTKTLSPGGANNEIEEETSEDRIELDHRGRRELHFSVSSRGQKPRPKLIWLNRVSKKYCMHSVCGQLCASYCLS